MSLQSSYEAQLRALLPPGRAWSQDPGSLLGRLLGAIAASFARVHARADRLVLESDPRTTSEMLVDWETTYGLPDPCLGDDPSLAARRAALLRVIKPSEGASFPALIAFAAELGFTITLERHRPFRAGFGRMGDPLGGPEWEHVLLVYGPAGDNDLLECQLLLKVGGHVQVLFHYA